MILAGIIFVMLILQILSLFLRTYNGDFPNYAPDHINFLKNFFLAQIDSYETGPSGVGWFMWTMKVRICALLAFNIEVNLFMAGGGGA